MEDCSIGGQGVKIPPLPEHNEHNGSGGVGGDETPTPRRSGMKRSSSENATSLGRGDGDNLVFNAEPVSKPWKQRFSFRQPRKDQVGASRRYSYIYIYR